MGVKVRHPPIVGIVVTISPSFNLYRMVVFPAASRPTINIRISFLPQRRSNSLENVRPMTTVEARVVPDRRRNVGVTPNKTNSVDFGINGGELFELAHLLSRHHALMIQKSRCLPD